MELATVFAVAGDSLAQQEDYPAMTRSPGTAGFNSQAATVASSRLTDAVTTSLVVGAFSLCLTVTLAVLSIRASMAMPF